MTLPASELFLEIPDLSLPTEFHTALDPHITPQQQQALDFMSGINLPSAGFTNFVTTSEESPWEVSTIHPGISKKLLTWCRETFNLKFYNVIFLRTKPNSIGPWHCEGPILKGRKCALNFLISGDDNNTKAEWGVHKTLDVHPEEIEQYFSGEVADNEVNKIAEYTSTKFLPFFYNTACLHRSFNQHADTPRVLLSVSVSENVTVKQIKSMYDKGVLFKNATRR